MEYISMESNWDLGKAQSNYHFEWNLPSQDTDFKIVARFTGDWSNELQQIKNSVEPVTWKTRKKNYHNSNASLDTEVNDLIRAGQNPDTVMYRRSREITGIWQTMVDCLGLLNTKTAFHIQYPGEMVNLHIDKQYEMNDDPSKVSRFLIFLEDWKPGHFIQFGTSLCKWQAGDVFWFDWANMPHATANAGWEPRCLLQCTGTITNKTQDILDVDECLIRINEH